MRRFHTNTKVQKVVYMHFGFCTLCNLFFFQILAKIRCSLNSVQAETAYANCKFHFIIPTLKNIFMVLYLWCLLRDGPLETLCGGGGGGFLSSRNFLSFSNSLYEFFRPQHEYFLGLIGVHDFFFSFNFPLRKYFYCTLPPPHQFSNDPSLMKTGLANIL